MKTYEVRNQRGRIYAFEIENASIQPRQIAAVLRSLNTVSDIRLRRLFASPSDVHVRFRLAGEDFIVWEPYGDSNRYWIGPAHDGGGADVNVEGLLRAFQDYRAPLFMRLLGDFISLRWLRPVRRH